MFENTITMVFLVSTMACNGNVGLDNKILVNYSTNPNPYRVLSVNPIPIVISHKICLTLILRY